MTEDRAWLKRMVGNGGLGDYTEALAMNAVRNTFGGLPRDNPLCIELQKAVVALVKDDTFTSSRAALGHIVERLDRELRADNKEPLSALATLYKAHMDEQTQNPLIRDGRG